jgi:hypothetical protein
MPRADPHFGPPGYLPIPQVTCRYPQLLAQYLGTYVADSTESRFGTGGRVVYTTVVYRKVNLAHGPQGSFDSDAPFHFAQGRLCFGASSLRMTEL